MSSLLDSFDQAASAASSTPAKKKSLTDAFDEAAAPALAPARAAPTAPARVGHWNNDVDANAAMGGLVLHAGSGAVGSIVGGLRGLATLAFPETMGANPGESRTDAAARISQEAQQQFTYNPGEQAHPEAAQLIQAAGSRYSPLTIPARAGGALGDLVNSAPNQVGGYDITAPKAALAASIDAGTQVLAPVGAIKYGGRVVAPLRGLLDAPTKIQPAEVTQTAAANAPAVKNAPSPTLDQAPVAQPSTVAQPGAASPIAQTTQPAAAQASTRPALPPPQLQHASPELQQAVAQAQAKGLPINQEALQRHVEADTLPVPVRMSAGQAALDPRMISDEMNSRAGKTPKVSPEFYNTQGKALGQNLDVIRQRAAPDVTADNPTDHGQVLVDQYKAMDAPVVADIDAKYQALRDANGGEFPVDAPQLLANTKAALKAELLSGDAPSSQMTALEDLAREGKMSYEQFLNLRRNLGNVARTSTDGNTRTAAGIMVQQLEDLPLQGGAADMKPLADAARSAARARFQAMDADPAYKAAVSDGVKPGEASPLADSFVQKYLINGPRANVMQMRQNLGNQPLAMQTIPAATVDYLRSKAKADVDTGQFNAASYNGVVDKLSPKFDALMDPASAATLQQVGNVAKYTTVQPKGAYVNNSNSTVEMMKHVALDKVGDALNTYTLGATGTLGGIAKGIKAGRAAKAATAPGAGITKLSDLAPPQE